MSFDALTALTYPFEAGMLHWPEDGARVLWLNAAPSPALARWQAWPLAAETFHRPAFNALSESSRRRPGSTVLEDGNYDVVLVHASHQHVEARGLLASGAMRTKPGGLLVAAAANDGGGRRLEAEFAALRLQASSASKYKARVVWTKAAERLDAGAAAIAAAGFQPVPGGLIACPGVFSWNRIDPGSALLARHLPALAGEGADFGCGTGFLSLTAFERGAHSIACVDADWRAVESARRALAGRATTFVWADIADPAETLPASLDWIVMNPPFHVGRIGLPALGQAFIARAHAALKPGGALWMVANSHLPYEASLTQAFAKVDKVAEEDGYKVFRAQR